MINDVYSAIVAPNEPISYIIQTETSGSTTLHLDSAIFLMDMIIKGLNLNLLDSSNPTNVFPLGIYKINIISILTY